MRAEVLEADEKDMESGEEALLVPALPVRTLLGGAWPGRQATTRWRAASRVQALFTSSIYTRRTTLPAMPYWIIPMPRGLEMI